MKGPGEVVCENCHRDLSTDDSSKQNVRCSQKLKIVVDGTGTTKGETEGLVC